MENKFCDVVGMFLGRVEEGVRGRTTSSDPTFISYLVRAGFKVNKHNVRNLLVYAATALDDYSELEKFQAWLTNRQSPTPRCLRGSVTGPARTAAEEDVDLMEVWYDARLQGADQPPVSKLNSFNIPRVLEKMSEAMDEEEFGDFTAWAIRHFPRYLAEVIEAYEANHTDWGTVHNCPICGQPAQSQEYRLALGQSTRSCACPQGHQWQVLW